ncbi:hypothetical protein DPMN_110876 [Dreissena polymorpha]|uniref:Tyrosine-protein phosphatase domain-containing protein n=1 Tax=Dreissena polymorpha TaxID=45954 RepID=A0A9D4KCT6_DREPO|nr:hypothetical protein DPMN_110876 [Dreissena polymorpha]
MAVLKEYLLVISGLFMMPCGINGDFNISILGSSLSTNASVYDNNWSVDRAVDGRIGGAHCECCTAIARPCSLQINLQQSYLVKRIVLKGRTDGAFHQFANITVYIGNDVSQMVEQPFSAVTTTVRTCVLSPPQAMQAITLIGRMTGIKDDLMTICEIEVYRQQDCVNGTYGPDCNKTCHCVEGPCDVITGTCGTGCKSGWRGAACNETCADGSYGTNCSLTCSAFCRNNRPCHHINGTCIEGCADGYDFSTDKTCNTSCEKGLFGHNCSSTCSAFCRNNRSCHHVNGMCLNGCEDGYNFITDNKCTTTCAAGSYGVNCSLTCSAFCRNNRQCHHINGTCVDGCEDGYDVFTDKTCKTPCGHKRYGRDCSSICSEYCHNKQTCHHINGTCPNGCGDGYDFNRDKTCNAACENRKFGKNCLMDCNCDECHHINGSCAIFKQQCDTGFKMDKDICQPCERRHFGPNCANECHCEQCHNVNGSCDLYTNNCDGGFRLDNGLCKPCGQRQYGQNCSTDCHCEICHNVNGSCALYSSDCDMGYRMENELCIENIEASPKQPSSSTGAIGGGVAAAVAVTIVIIVAVVCYKRRRMNNNGDTREFFNDVAMCPPTASQSAFKSEQQPNLKADLRDNIYANAKDIESAYYGFNTFATGIQLHELWKYIRDKSQIDSTYFDDEFQKLPAGLIRKHDVASAPSNKGKTRYKDLYAYDDSRVVLTNECPDDSDYINASYIHGFDKLKKFIASQGPTQKMISDFWRMIWQQKIEEIVMLTNLVELGTLKCLQYCQKI